METDTWFVRWEASLLEPVEIYRWVDGYVMYMYCTYKKIEFRMHVCIPNSPDEVRQAKDVGVVDTVCECGCGCGLEVFRDPVR
jgi:hypothetical protein